MGAAKARTSHNSRPGVTVQDLVWILPDQLLTNHPALDLAVQRSGNAGTQVVLIESQERLQRLPYHRKRQVLHISSGRHYVDELQDKGFQVHQIQAQDDLKGLKEAIDRYSPNRLLTMASSEYDTRQLQEWKLEIELGLPVDVVPNTMMIVGRFNPIPEPDPDRRYIMESFYRSMRKHYDVLMAADKPVGGKWNYDAENRKPLPKGHRPPEITSFAPDEITRQAIAEAQAQDDWIGEVDDFDLAVTREQAEQAFEQFLVDRLEDFGPYEDAMTSTHGTLYHSVLSPYMNLGLLEPLDMVRRAEQAYHHGKAPLNSVEGFIRQILGWREFMYWQYWNQMPELRAANSWQAQRPMPQLFWDGQTEMTCLSSVVTKLLETGYSHHIERLMVICNFCTLAGVDPAAVSDWFLSFYIDSHDWVVLPNVIGMGLNADGGKTATKPYISSANYINKMSDFCSSCHYQHKLRIGENACPFNALYWNFLIEHEATLKGNPRLGPAVLGLSRIQEPQRREIQEHAQAFLDSLKGYRTKLATSRSADKLRKHTKSRSSKHPTTEMIGTS